MTHSDKRSALRDRNRATLIEATLDCIVDLGIAGTSVSTIIDRAGLSRGMVHLHFDSKDKLLEAAVAHANAEYYDKLDQLLRTAGPAPQQQIDAIVRSDLSEQVLNRRYVSIWYAFRGAARDRAAIAAYSDTRDDRLRNMTFQAFLTIARDMEADNPPTLARDMTHGMLALLEGMWTDYLLHPDVFDRDVACRIIFRFLGGLMPAHFSPGGARV